ncbi:MAG TPA: dUTP diphosphatase [Bacteroidales bacterium]|jgi:dUTP pyrophosphatase|nr:dUTP diphosphatase [Bacteroidales bacterium]HQB22945.1 dUTP diphosphatase [Bacteroidales bacterium]
MKIRIINHSPYPMPEYATPLSAGMDIRAHVSETLTLQPLERVLVPTGLYIELPAGFEAQIRPRSGLASRKGITVLNSPGTIDADYRGQVCVLLVNVSSSPVEIAPGERVAQMVVAQHSRVVWEPASELNQTERGAGGFGSTGHQ